MPRVVDVEQRRTDLIDAAARLIARSGIESATMRNVAAEAGWTTGALTHYFSDKRLLLLAVFQDSLARRRVLRVDLETLEPTAKLRAALHGVLPIDDDRRRHWLVTIAFTSTAIGDAELAAAQQDAYREFRARMTCLVDAAKLTSGQAAEALAEQLIAAADGIAIQALFDTETWPAKRQLDVLDAMISRLVLR